MFLARREKRFAFFSFFVKRKIKVYSFTYFAISLKKATTQLKTTYIFFLTFLTDLVSERDVMNLE